MLLHIQSNIQANFTEKEIRLPLSEPVTYTLQGESYVAILTAQKGVILRDDWKYSANFTCTLNTESLNVNAIISASPNTPTASIEDPVAPDPFLKITDDTQTYTGTSLPFAYVGQRVRLHVYILPPLRDSFDIWVIQVSVENSEIGPVILTGVDGPGTLEGCQAKYYFAGVTRIGPGELMVEFDAFMLSPGSSTEDVQDWQVTTGVCAPPCAPVDCSGAPFGVRRKRDMSNDTTTYEEMHVRSRFKVTAFPQYTEPDVDASANEAQNGKIEDCEVCMQKSVIYSVTAVLVLALILSLAVSCFLFIKARKSRKILQEDSKIYDSANPSYKR